MRFTSRVSNGKGLIWVGQMKILKKGGTYMNKEISERYGDFIISIVREHQT